MARPRGVAEIDLEQTLTMWHQYRERVVQHYGFDESSSSRRTKCFKLWEEQLKWYFDANKDKILEYFHGLDRRRRIGATRPRQSGDRCAGRPTRLNPKSRRLRRRGWLRSMLVAGIR